VQEDKEGICLQFEGQGILKSIGEGKKEEKKMGMQIHAFMCTVILCHY